MRLDRSSDQEFFRETTARFLDAVMPVGAVRARRADPSGFDADYWRQGAELGWTSLLVAEALGGGSISGAELVDLTLVAHEVGAHAAPGPLVGSNVVAEALSATSSHRSVIDELVAGVATAAWCDGEPPPHDRLGTIALEIRDDGDAVVLRGAKRPVESAREAAHLLVTGRSGAGVSQVLVPRATPGVTITRLDGVDLTRRFDVVRFDDVRVPRDAVVGELGGAAEQVERQRQIAAVVSAAEAVGAMQRAFAMTVDWAFTRYSFGRPLASYQALKHRFADMKTWLEAGHAITDAAAAAVAADATDAAELASAAKAFVGHYGCELVQECVQMHGGIGVTFEHDLHLFLRRVTLDRVVFGTPEEHRARLVALVEARSVAA